MVFVEIDARKTTVGWRPKVSTLYCGDRTGPGLNPLHPVSFTSSSHFLSKQGSHLFLLFLLQNVTQCCEMFLNFSWFLPPWEFLCPPSLPPSPMSFLLPILPCSYLQSPSSAVFGWSWVWIHDMQKDGVKHCILGTDICRPQIYCVCMGIWRAIVFLKS